MILVSSCFYIHAFAQSTRYVVTGTDITLTIPDDFVVFTRNNIENHKYLDVLGYTENEYLSIMKQKNIFMEASRLDENYSIVLTVVETIGDDFNDLSNDEKNALIVDSKNQFRESNITINKSSFKQVNDITFLILEYCRESENNVIDVFCTQYSTIVNGYAYNISVDSFDKKLSKESASEVETIIESVEIKNSSSIIEKNQDLGSDIPIESIIGGIVGIVLWSLVPGFIAKRKNRSFWNYFFLSFLITPLISMIITICIDTKEKELSFAEKIERNIDEGIKRRETLYKGQNPEDPQFGYDVSKPICLSTITSSDKYLTRLRLLDSDTPFKWERLGSICTNVYGVKDMSVDKYILTNTDRPDEEFVVYICPYGRDSDYVPKGMRLVDVAKNDFDDLVITKGTEDKGVNKMESSDDQPLDESQTAKKVKVKVKTKTDNAKQNTVFCKNCGKELLGYENFCRKCGNKITKEK